MTKSRIASVFLLSLLLLLAIPGLQAQQTLGGITGTVTDKTGSILPDTTVTIVGDQTKLTRTQKTNANGSYEFVTCRSAPTRSVSATKDFRRRRFPRS